MKPPIEKGKQEPNRLHTYFTKLCMKHNTKHNQHPPMASTMILHWNHKLWVKVGYSKRRNFNNINIIFPMHFASWGHHHLNNILPLHFPLKAIITNHLLLIHQNLLLPPKTTRFMALMEPILHDINKPSSWGNFLNCNVKPNLCPSPKAYLPSQGWVKPSHP